jgi:hypothetical protein
LAAGLYTALVLISCLPPTVAAAEPPLAAVERAAHFEESLLRAKATGKDIVVLQRGSDWNRLGEMLYHEVWLKDEFAPPPTRGDARRRSGGVEKANP